MNQVKLYRQECDGKAVYGKLVIGLSVFTTLENRDHQIPEGTYDLEMSYSPKFKKDMPIVKGVPGRKGIRIHMGYKPEHSTGCILLYNLPSLLYVKNYIEHYKPIKITVKNQIEI